MNGIYVLEGPADCGNRFGYFKRGLVPDGRCVIVSDHEYANGGSGPCLADSRSYATREEAEATMGKITPPVRDPRGS